MMNAPDCMITVATCASVGISVVLLNLQRHPRLFTETNDTTLSSWLWYRVFIIVNESEAPELTTIISLDLAFLTMGPVYSHKCTSIPALIVDYIHFKMWDVITDPFLKVTTSKVWIASNCLGIGNETNLCATCPAMFWCLQITCLVVGQQWFQLWAKINKMNFPAQNTNEIKDTINLPRILNSFKTVVWEFSAGSDRC